MTDREGIITLVNPEFTRLYGYTAEEVVGKTTPRVLKSGHRNQGDYARFWKTILDKRVIKEEVSNKTKDGRLVDIENSANPILDEHGDIKGFLAIQRDITERKRAEETLRESETRLQFALDTSQMGEWELDLVDHTAQRSLRHDRIFGYETRLPECTYKKFMEHVVPEDRELSIRRFGRPGRDRASGVSSAASPTTSTTCSQSSMGTASSCSTACRQVNPCGSTSKKSRTRANAPPDSLGSFWPSAGNRFWRHR
jgi:PAS domain S-box-containing protein